MGLNGLSWALTLNFVLMNIKTRCRDARLTAILVAFCLFPLAEALAQPENPAQACRITPEAIVTLRDPFFGTPAIWDAAFGTKDKLTQFSGAVTLPNKNLLVVGEDLDQRYKPLEHILVELNNRSRVVDEKRYPAKTNERSSGVLATKKGYIVSSNISGGKRDNEKRIRLAWYDDARNFKREMILQDSTYDYESLGLSKSVDGNGFLAIVHAVSREDVNDQHGMLFRVSDSGSVLWKRAYRPGIPNQIYGVSPADDRHYIAGGRIRVEDGRMGGWILKLNDDGTIVWQNTYPRGNYAVFRSGYVKPGDQAGDHYVVTGQVMPIGEMPGAVWVLEVDSLGIPVWQRYIRAKDYDLDPRSIHAYGDGRISVMANAKPVADQGSPHIRLLTLSPRGGLSVDEAYLTGRQAVAQQMIQGWSGERIVIADIETGGKVSDSGRKIELITEAIERQEREKKMAAQENLFGPPDPTPEQVAQIAQSIPEEILHKGWVFVATALDPYDDPCVINPVKPAE